VLWIGGPPGSGKTTVATQLVRRHGLRWYNADTRTWAHRDRALRERHEAAHRWEALSPADRRTAPDGELLAMSLHRERGAMVVDDVLKLPASTLIVAEGTVLSAARVTDPGRAVCLVPTPELQRARLETRDGRTNRLYLLLSAEIERDAREHGVPVLPVDGTRGVDETVAAVEALFADALAEGPRAGSSAERRELLREGNLAIVAQLRAFYARPWADGDAESTVRTFVCECGDPACVATLDLPVGAVAGMPALARGHEPAQ
jgi:hypothetical protein